TKQFRDGRFTSNALDDPMQGSMGLRHGGHDRDPKGDSDQRMQDNRKRHGSDGSRTPNDQAGRAGVPPPTGPGFPTAAEDLHLFPGRVQSAGSRPFLDALSPFQFWRLRAPTAIEACAMTVVVRVV